MKKFLFTFLLALATCISFAQKELSLVLELQMSKGPGARAAGVAYHPELKRYYAVIAGNAEHAMAVYDRFGEKLSDNNLKAGFDVRGFWWNPKLKTFCANGYNDLGWVSFNLNSSGMPTGVTQVFEGMLQPDVHSVGVYNDKTNDVYFIDGQHIVSYSFTTGRKRSGDPVRLFIGATNEEDAEELEEHHDEDELCEEYNPALVYTGKENEEFALLNYESGWIELYSKKTGFITEILLLPDDAPVEDMLCFSYANGIYWLFDREARVWKGYK